MSFSTPKNQLNTSPWGLCAIEMEDPKRPWVKADEFHKILDRAIKELGIDYLDSAQGYVDCEEAIGNWLSQNGSLRSKFKLGTKISSRIHQAGVRQSFDRETINKAVHMSLTALKTESVDIYWLIGWTRMLRLRTLCVGLKT